MIEDDRALAEVLEYNLVRAGYEVLQAHEGRDGLNQARLKRPDLVILDVMLPLLDGLEVCRALPETRDLLIVMLTARSEESDELVGFSIGADDYVTKPFAPAILLQRIKALRRRESAQAGNEVVVHHGLTVGRRRRDRSLAGGGPSGHAPRRGRPAPGPLDRGPPPTQGGDPLASPRGLPADMAEVAKRIERIESQLRDRLETLEAERHLSFQVLGKMVEGVLAINPLRHVVLQNPAAVSLLRISREAIVGRPPADWRSPAIGPIAARGLSRQQTTVMASNRRHLVADPPPESPSSPARHRAIADEAVGGAGSSPT